jgi:hypothetical protein
MDKKYTRYRVRFLYDYRVFALAEVLWSSAETSWGIKGKGVNTFQIFFSKVMIERRLSTRSSTLKF